MRKEKVEDLVTTGRSEGKKAAGGNLREELSDGLTRLPIDALNAMRHRCLWRP